MTYSCQTFKVQFYIGVYGRKMFKENTKFINMYMTIKETMRKLVLTDILNILLMIKKYQSDDKIDEYILDALSGEILDKKAKKQIESMI